MHRYRRSDQDRVGSHSPRSQPANAAANGDPPRWRRGALSSSPTEHSISVNLLSPAVLTWISGGPGRCSPIVMFELEAAAAAEIVQQCDAGPAPAAQWIRSTQGKGGAAADAESSYGPTAPRPNDERKTQNKISTAARGWTDPISNRHLEQVLGFEAGRRRRTPA